MDTLDKWSSEDKDNALRADDFMDEAEALFQMKHTPEDDKVPLLVSRLIGRALVTFKGFTNAAGDTNNRYTTTFAELKALLLTLLPDLILERDQIEKDYQALSQKAALDKFVEQYKSMVVRINLNSEARKLHTSQSLLLRFQQKLKPKVQLHLSGKTFTSIEDAYQAAVHHDKLIFASDVTERQQQQERGRQQSRGGTPWSGQRQGTPPPHITAMLAALGYNWDGTQTSPGLRPPNGPSNSPTPSAPLLGAVERDHSVPDGGFVPRLTPEIWAWCLKHNACFRCRKINPDHTRDSCPRYANVPDRVRPTMSAIEEQQPGN